MKPKLWTAAVAAVAAALLIAGYWRLSHGGQPAPRGDDAAREAGLPGGAVASVQVASIKAGTLAQEITIYGTVVPAAGAVEAVSVPFESRIRRIFVTEAQKVSRGDALAEIEPSPDTSLQARQARNDYESAKSALQYMEQRFKLKLATNDQLLQTKQALDQAEAKLESMRRRGMDGPRALRARAAGLISKVSAQEGAIVPAGASLIELIAQNRLEARMGIEPQEIDKVRPGQEVSILRVNVSGSSPITARIRKISRATDPATRMVQLFADLPPASGFLLGEYIAGKITLGSAPGLIVPRSAVLPEGDHHVLFTVRDGRAREHSVRVVLQNEKDAEVIGDNLRPGDRAVTLGNYELKDGMAVRVDASR